MNKKYTLEMKKCDIYDSLFNKNTTEEILNISEKYLENPIFILDTSYKIIKRSNLAKQEGFSVEFHNGENYLIASTIELMVKNKCIDIIYSKKDAFFFNDDISLIFCAIRVNEITVGYICILKSNRVFEEEDLFITNALSSVISMQMQREDLFISSSGLDEEYYLIDLLTNRIDNIEYVNRRLKHSGLKLEKN